MDSPALAPAFEPHPVSSAALAQRLLNFVLFVTVLTSAIAFIEPSPHDGLIFVLLLTCVMARVPFDRKLAPLLLLTVLWLVGGAMSVIQVGDDEKALQYFGTSVYLGIACIMFACLFSEGNMVRLSILRQAYILAAVIATITGYIGFFHLLPFSDLFMFNERVSATFKDPNVYGPFLIYPLLLLMLGMLMHRVTLTGLTTMAFLSGGLLLSFSRGAWFHFGLSAVIAIAVLYVASPNPRMRTRIVVFGMITAIAIALVVLALTSIGSVHDLFVERAKAIQPYDVGPGGRFSLQELALTAILENPNGMGPAQFGIVYGGQQHNVYMECFLVYGWLGGATYLAIVVLTFMIGLRNMLLPAPWQGFLIAAYAAFAGEAVEGMIIDSDHWRHFFLIVGLVWGLSVATINWRRRQLFEFESGTALMPAAT
jgi:O-antigen ligase